MRRVVLLALVLGLLGTGCAARGVARPTLPRTVAVLAGAVARPVQARGVAILAAARTPRMRRQVVSWLQDGVKREYVEVAPPRSSGPLALVVVLHGRRQTARRAERSQGWDALARRDHVLVAYGAGYGGSWNAGRCCGIAAARGLDDVGYVLQIVRRAEARHLVDHRRVYLVGFSNGGMLAYRFACAHPGAISALAVVAGALEVPSCRPQRPLAVLDLHGGRDRIVPFSGAAYSRVAGAPTASVPASLAPWRHVDAGTTDPVDLVRLPRLGHDWPTWRNSGVNGTALIWRFLAAHPALTT